MPNIYRGTAEHIRRSDIRRITEAATELTSTLIRLSISALFRIELNEELLLIQTTRPGEAYFQPVGGVLKRDAKTPAIFQELQITDDPLNDIEADRVGDLRVLLPAKNLDRFWEWYQSGKQRESDYKREFLEELCTTESYLPKSIFEAIEYQLQEQFVSEITFVEENDRKQVYVAEICLPNFNKLQTDAIKKLRDECRIGKHPQLLWATREEVEAGRQGSIEIIQSARWTLTDL